MFFPLIGNRTVFSYSFDDADMSSNKYQTMKTICRNGKANQPITNEQMIEDLYGIEKTYALMSIHINALNQNLLFDFLSKTGVKTGLMYAGADDTLVRIHDLNPTQQYHYQVLECVLHSSSEGFELIA